jgi:hypothetical protein
MSSNGFGFSFAGLAGEKYIVEETFDFVTWTAVASLTNYDGQVHWTRPEPLTPEAQFYRARIALQDVVLTFDPGPISSNAVSRYYDDGYVLVDSLGNTDGHTYYWGYDAASQVNGSEIRLHAYGMKNGKAVWVITDTYPLNGMVVPEAPYRGVFTAPEPTDETKPRLQDRPASRRITFQ